MESLLVVFNKFKGGFLTMCINECVWQMKTAGAAQSIDRQNKSVRLVIPFGTLSCLFNILIGRMGHGILQEGIETSFLLPRLKTDLSTCGINVQLEN